MKSLLSEDRTSPGIARSPCRETRELLATGAERLPHKGRRTVPFLGDPGGNLKVSVENTKPERVTIWQLTLDSTAQATPLRSFEAPWPIANLAFSSDGSKLLVSSRIQAEKTQLFLAVADVATGDLKSKEIRTTAGPPVNDGLSTQSMALSPNGRVVAMSNSHGFGLVDLESGEVDYFGDTRPHRTYYRLPGYIWGRLIVDYPNYPYPRHYFSSDGRWLLSSVKVQEVRDSDSERVLIYDLRSRRLTAQIIGRLGAVSGDDTTLATSGGGRNQVTLWRLQDGVPEQFGMIQGLGKPHVLSEDGKTLVITGAGPGSQFTLWDLTEPWKR